VSFVLATFVLSSSFLFCFSLIPRPTRSTLFPYTTLFRSLQQFVYRASQRRERYGAKGLRDPGAPEHSATAIHRLQSEPIQQHDRSEEHTSELQSHLNLVCRLLLEKKKYNTNSPHNLSTLP